MDYTPQPHQPMIIGKVEDTPKAWAVVEYSVIDPTGALPPTSLYITACRLIDVATYADAARNSEWRKCVHPGHYIGSTIWGLGTRMDCQRQSTKLIMSRNPRPRCNVYGHNTFSVANRIKCSNGQIYVNQTEAAQQLGLAQSHISLHLKGKLKSVKGYLFEYVD